MTVRDTAELRNAILYEVGDILGTFEVVAINLPPDQLSQTTYDVKCRTCSHRFARVLRKTLVQSSTRGSENCRHCKGSTPSNPDLPGNRVHYPVGFTSGNLTLVKEVWGRDATGTFQCTCGTEVEAAMFYASGYCNVPDRVTSCGDPRCKYTPPEANVESMLATLRSLDSLSGDGQ